MVDNQKDKKGVYMMRLFLIAIAWVCLPLIIEFDYRFFNKVTGQNYRRKDYLVASIVEIGLFNLGLSLGWIT